MIENIRLAFQGIWSHMMRSFLTMLGIIIGIASIIAIVSTIKGTSEQIKEDLIGAGTNTVNVYLYDGDNQYDAEYGTSSNAPVLTDDVKEEVMDLDHVENATFYYNSTSASIYNNNNSLDGGSVYGIDVNYLATCGYVIQSGRGFVKDDYQKYNKVALIDNNAAENLFPSQNPVGQTVEINQEPYTIVGVIRQDENYQPTINSIDEYYTYYQSIVGSVMIPDACWPISFKFDVPQNVIVKADSTDTMSSVGNSVADTLNNSITISDTNSKMKYQAEDIMKQVKSMQKLSESTNNQLIWIASISLLVGGIGVMNIMLVSVTERTKEIGLKKAIGARKKTILGQFLTEASVLTSIGGIIGVVTGIGLSKVVGKVTGSPTAISVPSIVIAVLFSTVIGVVFGLLPSVKAANLNPIDALRSE
ncbi:MULTISPECIES: ABC transporter permease [unclassified Blautia]|uniref:ABC transporter permease n=1 Tax=unclassified Blautia TaxID=2648079 RepID=UPI001C127627|nr:MULTISPECIES: ABC transporter permease [unclassified Blautia]MBU5679838.1 ABC transporter permease [Blautia sp. MSJ-9]MCI6303291.1 ABC transporter permease [Blautia sp.]MCI7449358.1 ABC transporter permease [Blautia sp.]MDD6413942.1 ABC transporter permease [Blautia sp.]MDY4115037.1 ABC transporter permease [Blautia sp.]